MSFNKKPCVSCGRECVPIYFTRYGVTIGGYCENCWSLIKICNKCNKPHFMGRDIAYREKTQEYICNTCYKTESIDTCSVCGSARFVTRTKKGKSVCQSCDYRYFKCEVCGEYHLTARNFWEIDVNNQLLYQDFFLNTVGGVCTTCVTKAIETMVPNDVGPCTHCGRITINSYTRKKDGKVLPVCDGCASNLKECPDCGDIVTRLHGNYGEGVCSTCLAKDYYVCKMCGRYHTKKSQIDGKFRDLGRTSSVGNLLSRDGGGSIAQIVCMECVENSVECHHCQQTISKTSSNTRIIGGNYYCGRCAETVGECTRCKAVTAYKRAISSKLTLCRKCYAKEYKEGTILNYSYTPKPVFHGKGDLHLGFENETSFGNPNDIRPSVGLIYSEFEEDEVYIKSDSSISQGFEIVSHPFDFDSLRKRDWKGLFPSTCRKHESCGMHIHLSKSAFTTFHLFKFLSFINDNSNFIRTIAQRDENHYSQKMKDKLAGVAKDKETSTRYAKVNLQKACTIELRFFAHAVTEDIFLKNIEFAQSLFEFTRDSSAKSSNKITKYTEYLVDHIDRFPNICIFLGLTKKEVELFV